MTPLVRIERARPEDLNAVLALLAQHHLPPDGLSAQLATLLVARRDDRVVGSAALQIYEDGALLRSVAVASGAIYLLTTTADAYFPKLFRANRSRRSAEWCANVC